jgi:hypothetical protein
MRNGRISLPELVSRVDVHVDVEGWLLGADARQHVVMRDAEPSKESWYETNDRARALGVARTCAYEFGRRGADGIFCRVYRKDLELLAKPNSRWVESVWGAAGYVPTSPVTRVEFEMALLDFVWVKQGSV